MDVSSVIEQVRKNLDENLRCCLSETINEEEIPILPIEKRNEDMCITIFAKIDQKFSKKHKNAPPKIIVEFSSETDFDHQKLRTNHKPIVSIQFIYTLVKDSCLQSTQRDISCWAQYLFRDARKLYKMDYELELLMLPFEVSFDEDDNLYISRLPSFNDLWFLNPYNSKERLSNDEFINNQASAIIKLTEKGPLFTS